MVDWVGWVKVGQTDETLLGEWLLGGHCHSHLCFLQPIHRPMPL
jgi:hypothetical protein